MTTDEMLERANAFGTRFQWETLTRRTLRSWQELQLLPRPARANRNYKQGRGPGLWNANNYRDVLRLRRMRHAKLSDDHKCIALWLQSANIPFERVRIAAISQQERFRKRLLRLPLTWDPRQRKELQPRSNRALNKAIGINERVLVKYPRETLLKLIGAVVFEVPDRGAFEQSLDEIFTQLKVDEIASISEFVALFDLPSFLNCILPGWMADPEGGTPQSASEWIRNGNPSQFDSARNEFCRLRLNAFIGFGRFPTNSDILEVLSRFLKQQLVPHLIFGSVWPVIIFMMLLFVIIKADQSGVEWPAPMGSLK